MFMTHILVIVMHRRSTPFRVHSECPSYTFVWDVASLDHLLSFSTNMTTFGYKALQEILQSDTKTEMN
jgi:hypothetical protein